MCFFLQTTCGAHETILKENVGFFVGKRRAGREANHSSHLISKQFTELLMGCNCAREQIYFYFSEAVEIISKQTRKNQSKLRRSPLFASS